MRWLIIGCTIFLSLRCGSSCRCFPISNREKLCDAYFAIVGKVKSVRCETRKKHTPCLKNVYTIEIGMAYRRINGKTDDMFESVGPFKRGKGLDAKVKTAVSSATCGVRLDIGQTVFLAPAETQDYAKFNIDLCSTLIIRNPTTVEQDRLISDANNGICSENPQS